MAPESEIGAFAVNLSAFVFRLFFPVKESGKTYATSCHDLVFLMKNGFSSSSAVRAINSYEQFLSLANLQLQCERNNNF